MEACYLKDLQGEEWVYIYLAADISYYSDYFNLAYDITGILIETTALENGGFEEDDRIAFTAHSKPYDLDTLYTIATYGELMKRVEN
jgi:hypothetical protein